MQHQSSFIKSPNYKPINANIPYTTILIFKNPNFPAQIPKTSFSSSSSLSVPKPSLSHSFSSFCVMASKENPEEQALTETEDETIAAKKKRSRRVSFADVEITSVHIFKRDEDYYDTTPPSDPSNNANPKDPPSSAEDSGEKLGLFADLGDLSNECPVVSPGRYEYEDVDEDGVESRKAFFRPDDTPSPGSSNIGSATSNDG